MMGWQDKMKIMKTILYFLIFQIIIFSEPTKLDKIIYYRYFPLIEDKLKSGMEIQKIRGYCILVDMKCTTRGVFVAEEMDSWKQGPGESTLKKIDIDLSNFKKTFFIGEFRNDYPYFENLRQEILKENKLRKTLARIEEIIKERSISLIVLGKPLNMDDSEGERVKKTLEFAAALEKRTGLKVVLQDERLSSIEAKEILADSGIKQEDMKLYIDSVAASVILRDFMNTDKER